MKATKEFVEERIREFNAMIFGGELPTVTVEIVNARSFLGKMLYTKVKGVFKTTCTSFKIKISNSFDLQQPELEDVIIHELIHLYIASKGIRDNSPHGECFRAMMNRINSDYGRHMSIRHKSDEVVESSPVIKCHFVCILLLKDGTLGVTCCSKTKIFDICKVYSSYSGQCGMRLYMSLDPFFNRYPRSNTPKIYRISKEEVAAHLSSMDRLALDDYGIRPVMIRKGCLRDIPELMKLYRESREKMLSYGNLNQWKDGYPTEEMIRRDIESGHNHIIFDDYGILGAFAFMKGEDPTYKVIEAGAWLDDARPYATIHRLGSVKRAKGIADLCFEWCKEQCGSIRVDTHKDNSAMRHCIEKAGFRYCGVIHLANGDPRLAYQFV